MAKKDTQYRVFRKNDPATGEPSFFVEDRKGLVLSFSDFVQLNPKRTKWALLQVYKLGFPEDMRQGEQALGRPLSVFEIEELYKLGADIIKFKKNEIRGAEGGLRKK